MNAKRLCFIDTKPFADANLWTLGWEENWKDLKRILAPVTDMEFAVTDLESRLRIDDVRRRFDSSKSASARMILHVILDTKAPDKKGMADIAEMVLSIGVDPDLPSSRLWRPSHIVGQGGLPELVSTIFTCRPDMTARNNYNYDTPLQAAQRLYVSYTGRMRV